jgi:Ca2+-binding RTX toxin-like protein
VVFAAPGVLQLITSSNPANGGSNRITAGSGNNFIIGGVGNNTIVAGSGNDVVIGQDGEMTFYTGVVTVGCQDWLSQGWGEQCGSQWNQTYGWYTETFTGGLLDYVTSLDPTYTGETASITLGNGTDIVIGGTGNDIITVGNGCDIVIGDNGNVTYTQQGVLSVIQTSNPTDGGNNTITAGNGNDFILGGVGVNTITAGYGNDVIVGHDGILTFSTQSSDWDNPNWVCGIGSALLSVVSTDFGYGGNVVISAGTGNDVVIAGEGVDKITLTNGNDVVIGDDGLVDFNEGGALSLIESTNPAQGGGDTINLGNGNDFVIGGGGANIINTGTGDSAIIGANGTMNFCGWNPRSWDNDCWIDFDDTILSYMTSTSPSIGGNNVITAGSGQNVIIGGGPGANTITAGNGGDTIIGANGNVSFLAPGIDGVVQTSNPTNAGNETITAGTGNNRILGGSGSNKITTTGAGSNIIFGANGVLTFVDDDIEGDSTLLAFSGITCQGSNGWIEYLDGLLVSAVSTSLNTGGTNTIVAGAGQNLIVGGAGSNTITAGNGQNIVIGHNGQVTFCGAGFIQLVESIDPTSGPSMGTDVISVGSGNNIVIAGLGAGSITGGNGSNIVFGDQGEVSFGNFYWYQVWNQPWDAVEDCVAVQAQTIDPAQGGNDSITLGTGHNVVFGGAGNDTIRTGSSGNIIFGGDGSVSFSSGGWVTSASINNPGDSGTDTIYNGTTKAVVLSGNNDEIIGTTQFPVWQMESGPAPTGEDTSPDLTEAELEPVVVEAEAIWAQVLGPDSARLAILNGITVQVGELPAGMLGATVGDVIYIDNDAAGWGWFVDPTASGDSEFRASSTAGVLTAIPGSAASGHMDLLSTVLHELGNAMGFPEDTGQDVTGKVLEPGTRRLPVLDAASGATSVPAIDWTAIENLNAQTLSQLDGDGSWVDSFVNTAGQNGKHHHPNLGLRIKPLNN